MKTVFTVLTVSVCLVFATMGVGVFANDENPPEVSEVSGYQITQGRLEYNEAIINVGISETAGSARVCPRDVGHVEVGGQVDLNLEADVMRQTLSGAVSGSAEAWLERIPSDPKVAGSGDYEAINPMVTENMVLRTYQLGAAEFLNAGPTSASGAFEINGYSAVSNTGNAQTISVGTEVTVATSSH